MRIADERAQEPFEDFYRGHFEQVARAVFALAESKEEAHDIAQEAFVRTWERWEALRSYKDPLSFTLRVAANLAQSRIRRLIRFRRLVPMLISREAETQGSTEQAIPSEVLDLIRQLPPRQRLALSLCDVIGLSSEHAATIMKISPATLRVHLSRAHQRLRTSLTTTQRVDQVGSPKSVSSGGAFDVTHRE